MKQKNVHIIINPASGMKEPVLYHINDMFRQHRHIRWSVSVTQHENDAFNQTKDALKADTDVIAVYGGDGTVVQVARAMYQSPIPLAILPGGSANVIAKDLQIPINLVQALDQLIVRDSVKRENIDMALANNTPMLLNVSVGIFTDFTKQTSRKLKNMVGQAAYGIATAQIINNTSIQMYTCSIDGIEHTREGVGIRVANCENIGIPHFQYAPEIRMNDGKLDVVFIKNLSIVSASELVQKVFLKQSAGKNIEHHQATHIHISAPHNTAVSCDDHIISEQEIDISIVPRALHVCVPDYYSGPSL